MSQGDTWAYVSSLYYTYEELPYDDFGLLTSLDLHWNELGADPMITWDENVRASYEAIEAGDISGVVVIGKQVLESATETWEKKIYSINTGANQVDPSLTLDTTNTIIPGVTTPTFVVDYGTQGVEKSALEAKYKKYDSDDYETAVEAQGIAPLVAGVAANIIKTKSKYNFKKVDTNREFLTRNLTAFQGHIAKVGEIERLIEIEEEIELNYETEGQD
jgi:hypothetical protein